MNSLDRVVFPRRIRRGLIEAEKTYETNAEAVIFPRRIRRGLIEASHAGSARGSQVLFPRRIRRGLIEATSICASTMAVKGISAANSPRPH